MPAGLGLLLLFLFLSLFLSLLPAFDFGASLLTHNFTNQNNYNQNQLGNFPDQF